MKTESIVHRPSTFLSMDKDVTAETSKIVSIPHDEGNNVNIKNPLANEALECTEEDIGAIVLIEAL